MEYRYLLGLVKEEFKVLGQGNEENPSIFQIENSDTPLFANGKLWRDSALELKTRDG